MGSFKCFCQSQKVQTRVKTTEIDLRSHFLCAVSVLISSVVYCSLFLLIFLAI